MVSLFVLPAFLEDLANLSQDIITWPQWGPPLKNGKNLPVNGALKGGLQEYTSPLFPKFAITSECCTPVTASTGN